MSNVSFYLPSRGQQPCVGAVRPNRMRKFKNWAARAATRPPQRAKHHKRLKRLLIGIFSSLEVLQPTQGIAQSHHLFPLPPYQLAIDYIVQTQRRFPPLDDSEAVGRAISASVTVHVQQRRSFKRIFPGARSFTQTESTLLYANSDSNAITGSGFLARCAVDGQTYVLTTAHTVARAADSTTSIWVETYQGQRVPTTLLFADSFFDFAILSVDLQAIKGLPTIPFRKFPPRLTQCAYTIGTPLGRYPSSISEGIVSGFDRFFSDETGRFGYVQLTTPAVPGNSGGPAIDRQGRLIGMITKTGQDLRSNGITHLTFALESHHCERLLNDFIREGAVHRPWLGVKFTESNSVAQDWATPSKAIVRIDAVLPGQPFDRATLGNCNMLGARVLEINRQPINGLDKLYQIIETLPPSAEISLTLLQSGDTCEIDIHPEVLSQDAHVSIANHFIAQQASQLAGFLQHHQPTELAVRKLDAAGIEVWEKCRIIAAGFNTVDRSQLWEVMRADELGAIIRLFAIHGKVQFVLYPANAERFNPRTIQYHTFFHAPDSSKVLYH